MNILGLEAMGSKELSAIVSLFYVLAHSLAVHFRLFSDQRYGHQIVKYISEGWLFMSMKGTYIHTCQTYHKFIGTYTVNVLDLFYIKQLPTCTRVQRPR